MTAEDGVVSNDVGRSIFFIRMQFFVHLADNRGISLSDLKIGHFMEISNGVVDSKNKNRTVSVKRKDK